MSLVAFRSAASLADVRQVKLLKILPNTDRLPTAGQADYDPGLLIVDLFISEEQEQGILDEIARELGDSPEADDDSPRSPRSRSTMLSETVQLSEAAHLCFNSFIA